MIRKAYNYRIYPNKEQKEYFAKTFGCVRFFYNKSLNDMNDIYKATKKHEDITPATYKEDYPFLKEVDSLALSNAQINRNAAFKAFFRGNSKFPQFKSKRNDQSYTTNNQKGTVKLSDNSRYISIPKCKRIRIKKHRDFIGNIKSVTISKTTDEKYYISLLVEAEIKPLPNTDNSIGLDLGVKDLVIDSKGNKYKNHKYLAKSEDKLAKEQRILSHMQKGSSNRNKQRIKIARIYKHINNQRNDYLHKLSKHIIDENQIICVEDLKIKDMAKENGYNKSMMDASMSRLLTMLIYKANWYGRTIVKIPSDYPSSQLCSSCGYKNSIIKDLHIRKWICPECGTIHDRDVNAARNILSKGIELLSKDGTHPDSLFMLDPLGSSSKKPPLLQVVGACHKVGGTNMGILVSPSLLSADFGNLEAELKKAEKCGAEWIHYDVMDGHFVPNISIGVPVLKSTAKKTTLFKDVHLMISNPKKYIKPFVDAGADLLVFHYEACQNDSEVFEVLDLIHSYNIKAGISIKPNTKVNVVYKFLASADVILIMSVEPGFGGQKFDPRALFKIRDLRDYMSKYQYTKTLIEVDGGINEQTGKECVKAGVDVLVAGSYLFGHDDMKERVAKLKAND